MAGEAKTNAFMLGAATVMVGPMADVLKLTPAAHSIGLVKNFAVSNEQGYAELTQGTLNTTVFSQVNSVKTKATMEVFEYTAKNMIYGLGLDGSTITTHTPAIVKTAVVGDGATTDDIAIDSATDISSNYPVGSWIQVQNSVAKTYDLVYLGKVTAAVYAGQVLTITCAGHPVPTGVTLAAGDVISRVNLVPVGSKDANPFLGAKVVGILPDGNEPVTLIFPKIRITAGFNVAFKTDDYGNMPFEFTPYDLVSTDSTYSQLGGLGFVQLFKR